MPKIAYIHKDFKPKSVATIKQANQIILGLRADGVYELTLRQLYYQFVITGEENMSRLGFPEVAGSHNNERSYKRLGSIISDARLAGLVDWDALIDRTRDLETESHWRDPGSIIHTCAEQFRIDRWAEQPYHVEVWIEKEALVGVIDKICEDLDIGYLACKGYVSQSELWTAGQRMQELIVGQGKQCVVIHLGDHDPSGIDMTRDNQDRLRMFAESYDVTVERIALNMDQVEEYDPPPNPTKIKDSRSDKYIAEYGYECWELDALNPKVLRTLIEAKALEYRDPEIFADAINKEMNYQEILQRVADNWRTL